MTKMIAVPATEANNYSRILTLLGMEEEGDPVVEVERLRNDLARLERGAKSMSYVIDNHCIAMQSALIDAHERGHQQGLQWIWNTLVGPGLLPDFDEAKAMGGADNTELTRLFYIALAARPCLHKALVLALTLQIHLDSLQRPL